MVDMMSSKGRCFPIHRHAAVSLLVALIFQNTSSCKLVGVRYRWMTVCRLQCLRGLECKLPSSVNDCAELLINLPLSCVERNCDYYQRRSCEFNCASRFLINGTSICVDSCPHGYYGYLTDDKICERCHSSCDGCVGPSNRECKSCKFSATRDGTCVDQCPDGRIVVNGVCERPEFCHHLVENDRCVIRCSSGYFLSPEPSVCQQCDTMCKTCNSSGSTGCLTCSHVRHGEHCLTQCPSGAQFIQNNQCFSVCPSKISIDKKCVNACPSGQFVFNQTCVDTCPDSHQILKSETCVDSCDLLLHGRECIERCPKNTFILHNKCVSTCPKFYMGQNCTDTCEQFLYRRKCVELCPGILPNINGICVLKCPAHLPYKNPLTGNCEAQCEYVLYDEQCRESCPEYLVTFKDTCVRNCPPVSPYKDPINGTCGERCDHVIYGKQCLPSCPENTFQHTSNNSCSQCHELCVECYGALADECTECKYFEQDGSCVKNCIFPLVVHGNYCLARCPENTYDIPPSTICFDECPKNLSLVLGRKCVAECPHDMFVYQRECVHKCPPRTLNVNESTQCVDKCPPGKSFQYREYCFSQCPQTVPLVIKRNKSCISTCPGDLLYNTNSQACVAECGYPASKHFGDKCLTVCPSQAKFAVYASSYSFYECRSECPDGKVIDKDNPLECSYESSCIDSGNYINDNTCVAECPHIMFDYSGWCMRRSNTFRRVVMYGFSPAFLLTATLYAYCCFWKQYNLRRRLTRFPKYRVVYEEKNDRVEVEFLLP